MRQQFQPKSKVSYNKYVNATVCKSIVLWIESLIRKKILFKTLRLDNLPAFSTWFHSRNSSPSFHLTCSLIKEMPYKITFLKVSPTPLRYSVCVNSEYWHLDPTGDNCVAESMHAREPLCLETHTNAAANTHWALGVKQMCLNNATLFRSIAEILMVYIRTE